MVQNSAGYRGAVNQLARLRAAVTAVFAINGLLFGTLFARMPAIKADAGLGAGEIGAAFLAGSLGLIASQLVAGALCVRWGSRRVVGLGVIGYGLLLGLAGAAGSAAALAGAMFVLGIASGLLDVAMNAQGVAAERRHGGRIFSSFHAAFSLGGFAGAMLGGLAAGLELAPATNLGAIGLAGALAGAWSLRAMLPGSVDARPRGPAFARPSRALAALAAIGLLALMSEGAVGDWSAILLVEDRDADPGLAAVGLGAFSLLMAGGRLAADPLAARYGSAGVVRGGGGAIAVGTLLVIAPLHPAAAIAGYAVIGAGLAGVFPLTLRSAGRTPGGPPATEIAAVSTVSYAGFLLGPAIIGSLAELTSLPAALALLLPASAAVVLLSGAVEDAPAQSSLADSRTR